MIGNSLKLSTYAKHQCTQVSLQCLLIFNVKFVITYFNGCMALSVDFNRICRIENQITQIWSFKFQVQYFLPLLEIRDKIECDLGNQVTSVTSHRSCALKCCRYGWVVLPYLTWSVKQANAMTTSPDLVRIYYQKYVFIMESIQVSKVIPRLTMLSVILDEWCTTWL